ncbi:HAD-IA family hydrolase [Romeria aff. gracilis LEGE 07310]|uniref:HAD-IA family hydrolase n=1 Tax=Vasconcelosia minhoensis LEGE 07310 TaxID=915328 RepID=A0A8J7DK94_9CYAN|nr:HAD-IA family hydrolase [Romeria gracilis]MBE9076116.1 HAD-IA family hydrolase [Romeria aff. gracilis LEGE 07310]
MVSKSSEARTLQALIFDVDGTLAETERDGHRPAFNQAFAEAGLDWDWSPEQYDELLAVSGGKQRMRTYAEQSSDFQLPPRFADLDDFIEQVHGVKTQYFQDAIAAGEIPLRPGVERLIRQAREAGVRLAISTTTRPENVEALIKSQLGEDSLSWFDAISAGDMVSDKKPAPDVYQLALSELGIPAAHCLAIEDNRNGLLAAVEAGLTTVVTVEPYSRQQDLTEAALVLDNLGEPDQPFTVMAGNSYGHTYLDLALAEKLLAAD